MRRCSRTAARGPPPLPHAKVAPARGNNQGRSWGKLSSDEHCPHCRGASGGGSSIYPPGLPIFSARRLRVTCPIVHELTYCGDEFARFRSVVAARGFILGQLLVFCWPRPFFRRFYRRGGGRRWTDQYSGAVIRPPFCRYARLFIRHQQNRQRGRHQYGGVALCAQSMPVGGRGATRRIGRVRIFFFIGAWAIAHVPGEWLRRALPFVLVALVVYTYLKKIWVRACAGLSWRRGNVGGGVKRRADRFLRRFLRARHRQLSGFYICAPLWLHFSRRCVVKAWRWRRRSSTSHAIWRRWRISAPAGYVVVVGGLVDGDISSYCRCTGGQPARVDPRFRLRAQIVSGGGGVH